MRPLALALPAALLAAPAGAAPDAALRAALAEAGAAARRAVLCCAAGGLPLGPADWPAPRHLEITFTPGGVALS